MRGTTVLLLLAGGCQEVNIGGKTPDPDGPPGDTDVGVATCNVEQRAPRPADTLDTCGEYSIGAFRPWIEWSIAPGMNCTSTPAVADLDGDGRPEVIVNLTPGILPTAVGELWVVRGDDGSVVWRKRDAKLGMGSPLAVGDLDGDGVPEIVGIRASPQVLGASTGRYRVVVWDAQGNEVRQSELYRHADFDYATAPILADLDGDGTVEVVAGRVVLNADLSLRGKGNRGRGSHGTFPLPGGGELSEASIPAVADLDLDGVQEIITGNAIYDPDGVVKWSTNRFNDGMVAVANLDDDPEGEFVVTTRGAIRAHDTDGSLLWGPVQLWCRTPRCWQDWDGPGPIPTEVEANIASNAAIGDIDGDGLPEIVVAGGSQIVAFRRDGTEIWSAPVEDVSGATGASLFDFDADGIMEVVYADEVAIYAFDGRNGRVLFQSDEHTSNTMMEYPVIADIDADGSAEIVLGHFGFRVALTVYGAADGYWAPTRKVWNQHAYSIDNVNDDLSIPGPEAQGFTTHNSWHAAQDPSLAPELAKADLQVELVGLCEPQCSGGVLKLAVQPVNRAPVGEAEPGVRVSVYARRGADRIHVQTITTSTRLGSAAFGEQLELEVSRQVARSADALEVVIDDDGTRGGAVAECVEDDNVLVIRGPFCR